MGIGIFLFDSNQLIPQRYNSQRIYVYEDDMEVVLEGLAKTMRFFADPARRRDIAYDLEFGLWLVTHQPLLRP
jgi:hypothetical protein